MQWVKLVPFAVSAIGRESKNGKTIGVSLNAAGKSAISQLQRQVAQNF